MTDCWFGRCGWEPFLMERVHYSEETSDTELVAQFRQGAEPAFNALVRRHQQRALNVAFGVLRDREDATEVAQDAFVKVYQNIDQFRGDCAFTTWLHQIVVNLARNRYRWWKRRGRQAMISLNEPVDGIDGDRLRQIPDGSATPAAESVKRELVEQIGRAMDRLPRGFREVLVLRNIEDLSYAEIAVALGCSLGTVKSRIARARDALRQQLKIGE